MTERLIIPETAKIIANPTSAKGKSLRAADYAAERLDTYWGWQVDVQETKWAGHETVLAREAAAEGVEVVFSVGGDGTRLGVGKGLFGSETALAMIATGGVNVWSREMKMPSHPQNAVDALVNPYRSTIQTVDAGKITTEKESKDFLLMAGVGYDGTVINWVHPAEKERKVSGKAIYAVSTIFNMHRDQAPRGELTVDGAVFDIKLFQMWAGNTALLAYFEPRKQDAKCDDGLFEATMFEGPFSRKMPGANALLGGVMVVFDKMSHKIRGGKKMPWEKHWQGKKFDLVFDNDVQMPLEIDGDPMHPANAISVEVIPNALHVLVPQHKKKAHTLFSKQGRTL